MVEPSIQPKHQKRTSYVGQEDGSVKITTSSYFEKLAHSIEEIEKPLLTSFETLQQDVELALKHFTDEGSPKLVLTLDKKNGKPRLTKRWVTLRQNYPKR